MGQKVPFALVLYVASTVLDAYLGMTTLNPYRSFIFRIAAVVTVVAIFVVLIKNGGTLKVVPLILASLVLSLATVAYGGDIDVTVVDTCIKVAAAVLTVKPDLVEIEIETEAEEKDSRNLSDVESNGQ